jgi:hypothetical protein
MKAKFIMTHNVRLDSLQKWFDRTKTRVRNWSVEKKILAIISAPLFVALATEVISPKTDRTSGL